METLTNPDRELRIFISSTFRDMQAERDYLVRQVFPSLRKACQKRQVEFTDIDLRWGLTREEAEQGQVVRICLEEVDRCRPYFISLLGERYGWSPLDSDLEHKDELLEKFPFLAESLRQGLSITEMEILHGVLDQPGMTGHCFFYLRDPGLTNALAEQHNAPGDFTESGSEARDKLERLKARIRASGLPVREGYGQMEELGEWVRQDLLAVLDQRFPEDQTPSPLEAERLAHRSYAHDRIRAYIPNLADLAALDQHLASEGNAPCVVTGESGLGKSALLAYWVNQVRQQQPDAFIIEHYAGISGDADPVAVLRRIMAEIRERIGEQEELPGKPDEMICDFPSWLARVREQDPLILVIDGLNQLETGAVNWLPAFWPAQVKPLFSLIPGTTLEHLLERDWPTLEIQPLDQTVREQVIGNWLARYRKSLSAEQTQRLTTAPQTGNPLFLHTLLEELRTFGYFERLDQRIDTLLDAPNPGVLFERVLERLAADFGAETLQHILSAIWAARRGLAEEELLEITGLNRLTLSSVLLAIDAYISRRGIFLNFSHDGLRLAVQHRYLEVEAAQQESHRQLATYFRQQPEITQRVAEELPWQWQQAGEWGDLKDCISTIPIFKVLYERDTNKLLGYWLSLGDQYDPEECYQQALAVWEENSRPEGKELAETLNELAEFFSTNIPGYAFAEYLLQRAITIQEQVLGSDNPDIATSLNKLANLVSKKEDYDATEPLYRRALAIRERVLGLNHPDTAISLNNLANLLSNKGNYNLAEPLYRRALAILEQVSGSYHPYTAICLNNLAALLDNMADRDTAEPLYRRALAIREQVLGPNHPDTAISLNNLASLLHIKGDYEAAEPLYRRALAIQEQVLGPDHLDTAKSLNNLANLLSKKGDYGSAEPFYQRALVIKEQHLGSDHPDTALSVDNLACLFSEQGDYDAAEPLYRRALAIREQVLGLDHPHTATSLNNLANLLSSKGDYDLAEPLYRRALTICEQILGLNHPNTVNSLNNLASLFSKKADYKLAELLYRRVLSIQEEVLGPNHLATLATLNNLANRLSDQGDYDSAEPIYRRVLVSHEEVLGQNHRDTVTSIINLAALLTDKGDYDSAELLYRRALAIQEQVLDPNDPHLAASLYNLGNLFYDKEDYDSAEPLYRRALAIWDKVLGPNHPQTAQCLEILAMLLSKKGDYDAAEPLNRQALVIFDKVLGPNHPHTAKCLNHLGELLYNKGDYDAAEPLCRRALTILEQALGSDHPDIATNSNDLAAMLFNKGDYDAAEPLFRRALAIWQHALGNDDADTQMARDNLIILLNGPLSNREKIWKQPDFITAVSHAKALAIASSIPALNPLTLLLGAYAAHRAGTLARPIPALMDKSEVIHALARNGGLPIADRMKPVNGKNLPVNDELKALIQEFAPSTLECLVDAILWRINH